MHTEKTSRDFEGHLLPGVTHMCQTKGGYLHSSNGELHDRNTYTCVKKHAMRRTKRHSRESTGECSAYLFIPCGFKDFLRLGVFDFDRLLLIPQKEPILRQDTTANAHRLQLLNEQLVGIRDLNRAEVRRIAAPPAHPNAIGRIRYRQNATITTTETAECIGALHQPLLREL